MENYLDLPIGDTAPEIVTAVIEAEWELGIKTSLAAA